MSRAPDVVRMLTLVPWLLERPGATVGEIAAAFAASEADIRRELEHLDYCGLPGLGGGDLIEVTMLGDSVVVRMADELRLPMRTTPAETMRLLLAASIAEGMLGPAAPALRRAVAKLRTVLGVPEDAVVVAEPADADIVAALRVALAEGRPVSFTYRGRRDPTPGRRRVDPWALELLDGAWYLHAHDHDAGAGRIFRLDRASDLVVEDGAVGVPAPEHLESPRYVAAPDDVEAVVRLGAGATWLLDAVATEPGAILAEAGDRSVRLRVASPEWFVRLVLMAGGGAEVRGPDEVRRRVRDRAREALHRLESAPPGGPDRDGD